MRVVINIILGFYFLFLCVHGKRSRFLSQMHSGRSAQVGKLLFGCKSNTGIYMASSSQFSPNGVILSHQYKWIRRIGDNNSQLLIGLLGDPSSCDQLYDECERVYNQQTAALWNKSNKVSSAKMANYARHVLSESIITQRRPLDVQVLIGGCNVKIKSNPNSEDNLCLTESIPVLYWIDSFGSMKEVEYAVHGEDHMLVYGAMDRYVADRGKSIRASHQAQTDLLSSAGFSGQHADSPMDLSSRQPVAQFSTTLHGQLSGQPTLTTAEGAALMQSCWQAAEQRLVGGKGSNSVIYMDCT